MNGLGFIEGIGIFPYFQSIIFVANYEMNIINSHKMFIISPSVRPCAGDFECQDAPVKCPGDTDLHTRLLGGGHGAATASRVQNICQPICLLKVS